MKSIADVVGASGLSGYAEIALLIFFAVFVAVGLRAVTTNRAALDHAARLPLDDDAGSHTSTSHAADGGPSR
jgi:cbb3-type cytochrome oxidase subunit 3